MWPHGPGACLVSHKRQRIFSILKGEEELEPKLDEQSIYELPVTEPVEVT